jgi:hypothetical protein
MPSEIRYSDIFNTTGAVLTTATGLVIDGKDGGVKAFKRSFAAIDIGVEAGKTRDATDPTKGCLVCQVSGATIKGVLVMDLYRPTDATNQSFNQKLYASAGHFFRFGWRTSTDGRGLYIYDIGDDAATRIAANDFLMVAIITGNY